MKLLSLILAVATIGLASCSSIDSTRSVAGVVGLKRDCPVGSFAPNIPFTSTRGKRTTLHEITEPIAIVAFTRTSDENCCRLAPELFALSKQFRNLPVTVVQISLPTRSCLPGPNCVETCNLKHAQFVSLCDPELLAWKSYMQPKPNTVFLVDQNCRITDVEMMEDLKSLTDRAHTMAEAIQEARYALYEGY